MPPLEAAYSHCGRPSIVASRRVRAPPFQLLYSVRSERRLIAQLWPTLPGGFVGEMNREAWDELEQKIEKASERAGGAGTIGIC